MCKFPGGIMTAFPGKNNPPGNILRFSPHPFPPIPEPKVVWIRGFRPRLGVRVTPGNFELFRCRVPLPKNSCSVWSGEEPGWGGILLCSPGISDEPPEPRSSG